VLSFLYLQSRAVRRLSQAQAYARIVSVRCTKSEKLHKTRISGRLVNFPLFLASDESKAMIGRPLSLFRPSRQEASVMIFPRITERADWWQVALVAERKASMCCCSSLSIRSRRIECAVLSEKVG